MSYENLRKLPADQFRRACGVLPGTFEAMVEALEGAEQRKRKSGRPPVMSLPDQLLVTLLYHYDYRTQLQLGVESGLGESAICRLIQRVEDRLLADERFHLPKRRERVQRSAADHSVLATDAAETPIERPKKSSKRSTVARKKTTPSKAN